MNCYAKRSIGLVLLSAILHGEGAFAGTDSFRELSAEWWQWAISVPTDQSPLLDETGKYCMVGQRGDTWFLAGTFGATVSRSCELPKGVTLFFPVINSVQADTPNACGQGADRLSIREMRGNNGRFVDGARNLLVELDGRNLTSFRRTDTDVFSIAVPGDNLFGCSESSVFNRTVADGYYMRLSPLNPGSHALHIHAENPGDPSIPDDDFSLDVTYSLSVTP